MPGFRGGAQFFPVDVVFVGTAGTAARCLASV